VLQPLREILGNNPIPFPEVVHRQREECARRPGDLASPSRAGAGRSTDSPLRSPHRPPTAFGTHRVAEQAFRWL